MPTREAASGSERTGAMLTLRTQVGAASVDPRSPGFHRGLPSPCRRVNAYPESRERKRADRGTFDAAATPGLQHRSFSLLTTLRPPGGQPSGHH
jgi:hypothetical protein